MGRTDPIEDVRLTRSELEALRGLFASGGNLQARIDVLHWNERNGCDGGARLSAELEREALTRAVATLMQRP